MALMLSVFSLRGFLPPSASPENSWSFAAAVEKGYFCRLVIVAMVNATISLYYYILVVKAAYLAEPEGNPPRLKVSAATRVLAGVLVTIMVAAGIFPHRIWEVASAAARSLM